MGNGHPAPRSDPEYWKRRIAGLDRKNCKTVKELRETLHQVAEAHAGFARTSVVAAVLSEYGQLVLDTPKDTGRARAGWPCATVCSWSRCPRPKEPAKKSTGTPHRLLKTIFRGTAPTLWNSRQAAPCTAITHIPRTPEKLRTNVLPCWSRFRGEPGQAIKKEDRNMAERRCPTVASSKKQQVFVALEDVSGTLQRPTAEGFLYPAGRATLKQTGNEPDLLAVLELAVRDVAALNFHRQIVHEFPFSLQPSSALESGRGSRPPPVGKLRTTARRYRRQPHRRLSFCP